jgi:hypothetical protein
LLAAGLGVVASALAQAPAPAAAPAAAPASVPRTPDAAQTPGRHGKKMSKNTKVENPDAALLEYLGDYGDAADGLDPMGLAEPDMAPVKSGDGKDGQGNR